LEPQRAEGREPADPEAGRRPQVPEPVGEREAGADDLVELGRRGRLAELVLGVPGVAGVEEDDAADADLVDDRELELEVLVRLEVAADVRPVRDGPRGWVQGRGEGQARADAAEEEAADVEDAAEE